MGLWVFVSKKIQQYKLFVGAGLVPAHSIGTRKGRPQESPLRNLLNTGMPIEKHMIRGAQSC
jgi:hypothetical protein